MLVKVVPRSGGTGCRRRCRNSLAGAWTHRCPRNRLRTPRYGNFRLAGWLAALRRLRCVVSLEAGVNHFLDDPAFPQGVPVLRLGGEPLAVRMREYVLLAVLSLHRDLPGILENRRDRVRSDPVPPTAAERDVGIMGLGVLGRDAANVLSAVGFRVSG